MSLPEVANFVDASLVRPAALWDEVGLRGSAALQVPDLLLQDRGWLLRADINQVWSEWFVNAICDPGRLADAVSHAVLFEAVWRRVGGLAATTATKEEKLVVSKTIADLIRRKREAVGVVRRARRSHEVKRDLLEASSGGARCWICGYPFGDGAVARFLGDDLVPCEPLPLFVDFITRRGMKARDFQIEIDHMNPFSAGGGEGENLRISCGWCNANKSWRTSLYHCGSECAYVKHPKLGGLQVPQPFWVVRLLASKRRCEHPAGCTRSNSTDQLFVAPRSLDGAMNPVNVMVTCQEHDGIRADRLVPRMWMSRT